MKGCHTNFQIVVKHVLDCISVVTYFITVIQSSKCLWNVQSNVRYISLIWKRCNLNGFLCFPESNFTFNFRKCYWVKMCYFLFLLQQNHMQIKKLTICLKILHFITCSRQFQYQSWLSLFAVVAIDPVLMLLAIWITKGYLQVSRCGLEWMWRIKLIYIYRRLVLQWVGRFLAVFHLTNDKYVRSR